MRESISASARPDGPPPSPERVRPKFRRRLRAWLGRYTIALLFAAAIIMTALVTALVFFAIPVLTDHGFVRKSEIGKKWKAIDTDDQYGVAVHEAAHVIVGHIVLPDRQRARVYVKTRRLEDDTQLGAAVYADAKSDSDKSLEELEAHVLVDFAGQVAEEVIVGKNVYKEYTDTDHATDRLYERIRRLCEKKDACDTLLTDPDTGKARMIKDVVDEYRKRARDRAKVYIEANREAVIRLANRLVLRPEEDDRRQLDTLALYAFFAEHAFTDPEADEAKQEKDPE